MRTPKPELTRRQALFSLATLPLALAAAGTQAHPGTADLSAASSLSLSLPVAVLIAAPVAFLFAGAVLTVAAVEASASLHISGGLAVSALVGVGTAISVTAVAAGWLLSVVGEVLCIVPNALGESLLYNERIR